MTTVNQYITQITPDPENAKHNAYSLRVMDMFFFYCQQFRFAKELQDYELYNSLKDTEIKLNHQFTEINKLYRTEIAGVSADYKKENVVVWSFAGKYLTDAIGERFNFNFNRRNYKERTRLTATYDKIREAFIVALAFLFAKNKVVYEYQIQATFVKMIVDFFDFESVTKLGGEVATAVYYDVRNNYDVSVIFTIINDLGLFPVAKKSKKKTKKQKLELPPKEQFETWLASGQYKRNELQDMIATQYGISRRTVQRLLADYGLTRKYKK